MHPKVIQVTAGAALATATLFGITACGGGSSTSSPTPDGSFSFNGGSVDLDSLPSTWPSDAPTPQGLAYQGGADIGSAINASWSGPGDVTAIYKQLAETYKSNGWKQENEFMGNGDSGGVAAFVKDGKRAQIVAATQDGKAVINIAIVPDAG